MVVARLIGGLGNQMFQYACGKALSLHHNTDLKLDISWFKNFNHDTTLREYGLSHFALQEDFAREDQLGKYYHGKYEGLLKPIYVRWKNLHPYYKQDIYREKTFSYDPNIWKSCKDVLLDGYWQSQKYFQDFEEEIRRDFRYKTMLEGKNIELSEAVLNSNAISIHVRRQDYVTHKNISKVHGALKLEYYQSAIAYLVDKVKKPVFFVFSDDAEWCKENLKISEQHYFVSHNTGSRSFEDMRLMSLCHHNIVANSSFSWWSAWLNDNAEKIIITPKNWFLDNSKDTKDLVPENWIKL